MSKNLGDLHGSLFEQLDRLNKDGLKGEELKQEIDRAKAMGSIAQSIIKNGELVLRAKTELSPNVINNTVPMLGVTASEG